MITCSKLYSDFPFAHRQWRHDGHCSKLHGHNFSFKFTFAAETFDSNGFVVDFGKLKGFKERLTFLFDHTLVLNQDDPDLAAIRQGLTIGNRLLADIVLVPNCGAEGLAHYLLHQMRDYLPFEAIARGVYIQSVEVFEDTKNAAIASR